MASSGQRVAVIGAGNLGLLYAALLARSRETPPLLVSRRAGVRDAVRRRGIRVRAGGAGTAQSFVVPAGAVVPVAPEDIAEGDCDVAYVLCRTYDSTYAMKTARASVGPGGVIVCLQNGLTGWDVLQQMGGPHVCGMTYVGGRTTAENEVVWTLAGPTVLGTSGRRDTEPAATARPLLDAGLDVVIGPDEATVVWRKVLLLPISWVCAALGARISPVLAADGAVAAVAGVIREVFPLAARDGADVTFDDLMDDVRDVAAKSGLTGSAYEGLVAGQPLEIVEICDSLLRRAQEAGVDMPRTLLLRQLATIQQSVFREERARRC